MRTDTHSVGQPPILSAVVEQRNQLAEAFAILYDQALNGVLCDPHMHPCDSCKRGFALGTGVLDGLDPQWGNFFRGGPKVQPTDSPAPREKDAK